MERAMKLVVFSVLLAALTCCGGKHPDPYKYTVPELVEDYILVAEEKNVPS